jgi:hypothetical protein
MNFTGCAIDGILYGRKFMDDVNEEYDLMSSEIVNSYMFSPSIPSLLEDNLLALKIASNDEKTMMFFKGLAICHSIQTFKKFFFIVVFVSLCEVIKVDLIMCALFQMNKH